MNLQDIFGSSIPKKSKRRRTTVSEARKVLSIEEAGKLIDHDEVMREANATGGRIWYRIPGRD